jgi:hypothetical protein
MTNFIGIGILIATLVQSGALKSTAQFKWSDSHLVSPRTAISWDSDTGLPTQWDKELFPFPPICTMQQAVAAYANTSCVPVIDGNSCYTKRSLASLLFCGAHLPVTGTGQDASISFSLAPTGNYITCRPLVSAQEATMNRNDCKICRAVNGKTVRCRKISRRQAIQISQTWGEK